MDTIALASDHAGFALKAEIAAELERLGYDVRDLGTDSAQSVDYPDFGAALAQTIGRGEVTRGVLICGTGLGISMAANRYSAVRAAPCTNATMARLARQHNDANVLALGQRLIGIEIALECLRVFLTHRLKGAPPTAGR